MRYLGRTLSVLVCRDNAAQQINTRNVHHRCDRSDLGVKVVSVVIVQMCVKDKVV